MRPHTLLSLLAGLMSAATCVAQNAPRLPHPVTNNAVASGRIGPEWWIFSALGVDSTKRWSGITRRAAAWRSGTGVWRALPDVPGSRGRLAATAQVVRGRLFVFGGYTVDSSAHESSLPGVDIYDTARERWTRGADIPVPVDDATSGVWRDSLVYLVSGWHDTDNVRDVQVYDVVQNRWSVATPIPGAPVFGHSGTLAGNTFVFVDGAVRQSSGARYRLQPQTWLGTIDPANPLVIAWRAGPAHPGPAVYRAAAGVCGPLVVIAGGTDNPYNYDGIGYDSVPSKPRAGVMAFDTRRGVWREIGALPVMTMDHRSLAVVGDVGMVVGGMRANQRVSGSVVRTSLGRCTR